MTFIYIINYFRAVQIKIILFIHRSVTFYSFDSVILVTILILEINWVVKNLVKTILKRCIL